MRARSDYVEDFDDVGFRGSPRLQRMIDEQRHRVKRMKTHHGFGPADKWDDEWSDDEYADYSDYSDYADYNEDEFDSYSIVR